MVQALPSITTFTLRYHQPPQLLNPEGKRYIHCKPLPMKRNVLRKIKINGNCNRNGPSYFTDPYQSIYLKSHQRKSKPTTLNPMYYCMREPNHHIYLPSLSPTTENASTNQIVSKRRVRFSKTTDVYELPERTLEDRLRSWYGKNDYSRFGNERKHTVYVIQQLISSYQLNGDIDIDEYLDPTVHTILGVEQYIYGKEQIFRRKFHMLHHIRTVLQNQQLQQHHQQQQQQHNFQPNMVQEQDAAKQYYYPECFSRDASNYQANCYPHPSTSHDSYLRYTSHLCGTTIQYPVTSMNPFQQPLHVL